MKRLLIALCLFLPLGLAAQQTNNCDKIQNENLSLKNKIAALQQDTAFLHSKLAYYDKLNSNVDYSLASFSSQYIVKVLNCSGDRGAQTVRIDFVLHHKRVNQEVTVYGIDGRSNAYDEIGNAFTAKAASLGTVSHKSFATSIVPTALDVRGYIIFSGVIGGTSRLKLVQIFVESKDADGRQNGIEGKVDIRNLKIDWQ
jgi:hypothetical protein